MRQKIVNIKSLKKLLNNICFWLLTIINFILFFGTLIYVWFKHGYITSYFMLTSEIISYFNRFIAINLIFFCVSFFLNLYHFNHSIRKIVSKDNITITNILKSLSLLCGIVILLLSGMFYRVSNLTLTNFNLKTTYVLLYISLFIGAFFLFYIFSFITVISQDETENHAPSYIYRLKKVNFEQIKNSIVNTLNIGNIPKKVFSGKEYSITYLVSHEEKEIVYAFLELDEVTYEFVQKYAKERLTDFVEYLYSQILDKEKKVYISYFIAVKKVSENLEYLVDLSSYHDEHFTIIHNIVDLERGFLYISGVREDLKENDINYENLKDKIIKSIVNIIEITDTSINKKSQN